MKKLLGIFLLFLFVITKLSAQLLLLVNNEPNKEINKYFESKCLDNIRAGYEEFINSELTDNDSFFNFDKENSNYNNFRVYIIPEAYFTCNINEWPDFNKEIINCIEIDTNRLYIRVYFQKDTLSCIQMIYNVRGVPKFSVLSITYLNKNGHLKEEKELALAKRFQIVLNNKPDNIFIMRWHWDYICFQKGTKVYYYDPFAKQVKPLVNFDKRD